jgi:hypothetical protein
MEETLFNELYKQDRLGKRADMRFKSEAWTVVRDAVQDVYAGHIVIEISHLKNKESNYKALYKDWKWLKEQSGFGRDPDSGAITASFQAWSDVMCIYLITIKSKTRKTCRWHRFNILKYTDTLDELYSMAIATGARALTLSNIDPFLGTPSPSQSLVTSLIRKRGRSQEDTP